MFSQKKLVVAPSPRSPSSSHPRRSSSFMCVKWHGGGGGGGGEIGRRIGDGRELKFRTTFVRPF